MYLGNVIEADNAGAYSKLIAVDGYSVSDASVIIHDQSATVSVEGQEISIGKEQRHHVSLDPREIEAPEYEQRSITVTRNGITNTKTVRVQSGTKSVEVVPEVSVHDHGEVNVIGRRDARVFPETMPGANAFWHAASSGNRNINDGVITIMEEI